MRKVSVIVLGVMLLLVFAIDSFADAKFLFSGSYRTRYIYQSNLLLLGDTAPGFGPIDKSKSANFDQRFRTGFKIMPTENLTMNIFLEAMNGDWGADVNNATGSGAQSLGDYFAPNLTGSVYVRYAYMDANTQYGLFSIGRQSIGVEGLSMMGYSYPSFIGNDVFDSEHPGDRFKWVYKMDPLTVGFAFDKILEADAVQGGTLPPTAKNADSSDYLGFIDYRFSTGGVWFSYTYAVDGSQTFATTPALPARYLITTHTFNPAAYMTFGPLNIGAELRYLTGKAEVAGDAAPNLDMEGLGFYIDGTYSFGAGNIGLQYAYFQGDDNATDNKMKGNVNPGVDYCPFLIAYELGVNPQVATLGGQTISGVSNHWMAGLHGNYNITEDLLFHAGLGYFKINEAPAGWSKTFGTEFDVDLKYNIMPNLDYTVNAGYFWSGDYLKGGSLDASKGNGWAVRNEVTMTW